MLQRYSRKTLDPESQESPPQTDSQAKCILKLASPAIKLKNSSPSKIWHKPQAHVRQMHSYWKPGLYKVGPAGHGVTGQQPTLEGRGGLA